MPHGIRVSDIITHVTQNTIKCVDVHSHVSNDVSHDTFVDFPISISILYFVRVHYGQYYNSDRQNTSNKKNLLPPYITPIMAP